MPNPAEPLRYRVLLAIQTALRAINGNPTYFHTVKSSSVQLDPSINVLTVPPTEAPYFIIEPAPDGNKFYMPAMRLHDKFEVLITARGETGGGTSLSAKTLAWERLMADMEVAITQDVTLGGIVIDTRLQTATPGFDLGASPTILVVQPITCTLIRTYGAP